MDATTKILTIVRDPVDLFESMYAYSYLDNIYGNLSLKDFIRVMNSNHTYFKSIENNRRAGLFGRGQMAWDLGIDPSSYDDQQLIETRIGEFDDQFHLFMVAERLEESLVMLRHLLCWPMEHVTHLKLNQRRREKERAVELV